MVVEKGSFLSKMIKIHGVVQLCSTIVLSFLAVTKHASFIYYNWRVVQWPNYLAVLLIQAAIAILLLMSLNNNVKRRKAWFAWISTFFLGFITISTIQQISIHSNLTIYSLPTLISGLVLVITAHRYVKKRKTYGSWL